MLGAVIISLITMSESVMPSNAVQWLQQRFSQASDVKSSSIEPDNILIFQAHQANFIVQTWMGGRIYVYYLVEPPRVRDLRAVMRENSRDGIGTLFVLDGRLLPPDGETSRIEDWQECLQWLTDGSVYAVIADEDTPDDPISLIQANFTASPTPQQYFCWYTRDFMIENVSVRRREISSGIRGEWHLADIASPKFKRRVNYERLNQRHHYRTRTTEEVRLTPVDELRACYEVLNVRADATEREVKAAYRQVAMKVHPDVSALPAPEAERRFKQLQEAYERIKEYHGWA